MFSKTVNAETAGSCIGFRFFSPHKETLFEVCFYTKSVSLRKTFDTTGVYVTLCYRMCLSANLSTMRFCRNFLRHGYPKKRIYLHLKGRQRTCSSSGVARGRGRRWSLTIRWPERSFALSFSIKKSIIILLNMDQNKHTSHTIRHSSSAYML